MKKESLLFQNYIKKRAKLYGISEEGIRLPVVNEGHYNNFFVHKYRLKVFREIRKKFIISRRRDTKRHLNTKRQLVISSNAINYIK